ncbi:hypothetical protein BS78_02G019000 [Paspalum vaginatum]|nr:hypothetical protein BS78_02G019000 [Paspalum vaginatum]
MEELVEEILLRLPPQEPAHLVRAALVCKAWRTMLCDSSRGGFPRRYREFHGTPHLVGYLHNSYPLCQPRFVPAASAAFPPLSMPELVSGKSIRWVWALDCRHGRVLFVVSSDSGIRFIVWDPITRDTKYLTVPAAHRPQSFTAAVLCAIDGCDHLDCHGGPFRVVLVENATANDTDKVGWATIYSSETDAWSAASPSIALGYDIDAAPSLLIGDALYFTITASRETITNVLKDNLDRHELSVISVPGVPRGAVAMKTEDGGLGFVFISRKRKRLYQKSWQATGANGAGRWACHRTIDLETAFLPEYPRKLIGHADGTDTILVRTDVGAFTLDLKSRQSRTERRPKI